MRRQEPTIRNYTIWYCSIWAWFSSPIFSIDKISFLSEDDLPGQKFGNMAGLALIVLGTAMVGIAAARFVRIAKNIDREDVRPGTGSRIDIALAGLLVLLGCALFLYLSHALVTNL